MSTLANIDFRAPGGEIIGLVQRRGQERCRHRRDTGRRRGTSTGAGDPPRSARRRAWRTAWQQARCRGKGTGTAGATPDVGVTGDTGPANERPPIKVHVGGGCYAAGRRRRPVPRDEARRLLTRASARPRHPAAAGSASSPPRSSSQSSWRAPSPLSSR
ncbi:DUF6233 domain-containing protein, partial [Streptomyces mirabilis]|uniref:DUF6233 domain-containing protein n=1 Tax=Streptomyces mirabilis TaxID=68239 RepID=UPI0036803F62